MSSLIGVSSGTVTSITEQRFPSESISTTACAWLRSGPPRAASSTPEEDVRNVSACPVAGASTTIRSAAPASSSCFSLPRTSTSRIPGIAVAMTSSVPVWTSRLATLRSP